MDVSSLRSCQGGALVAALVVLTSFAMPSGADSLDQITVQSQRDREKLKHDVNAFVATAIVQSRYDESLERWTYAPICPLVAGLNKEQGEFILARLSKIAKTAGAPLAPEKCKPNLFVIVSSDPEPTLKKLADRHNGGAFNYATGAQLKQFVETSRPIRVWYNAGTTSIDGVSMVSGFLDTGSIHAKKFAGPNGPEPMVNTLPSQYGSRLNASLVTKDILSVIVVVDATKVRELNCGQLSDYVGMVGLAQIDLDKDLGDAPTILSLLKRSAESRPMEMSGWDRALLHALYSTPQRNKMQLSEMQTAALEDITTKTTK
jgi:hypothetical protein